MTIYKECALAISNKALLQQYQGLTTEQKTTVKFGVCKGREYRMVSTKDNCFKRLWFWILEKVFKLIKTDVESVDKLLKTTDEVLNKYKAVFYSEPPKTEEPKEEVKDESSEATLLELKNKFDSLVGDIDKINEQLGKEKEHSSQLEADFNELSQAFRYMSKKHDDKKEKLEEACKTVKLLAVEQEKFTHLKKQLSDKKLQMEKLTQKLTQKHKNKHAKKKLSPNFFMPPSKKEQEKTTDEKTTKQPPEVYNTIIKTPEPEEEEGSFDSMVVKEDVNGGLSAAVLKCNEEHPEDIAGFAQFQAKMEDAFEKQAEEKSKAMTPKEKEDLLAELTKNVDQIEEMLLFYGVEPAIKPEDVQKTIKKISSVVSPTESAPNSPPTSKKFQPHFIVNNKYLNKMGKVPLDHGQHQAVLQKKLETAGQS